MPQHTGHQLRAAEDRPRGGEGNDHNVDKVWAGRALTAPILTVQGKPVRLTRPHHAWQRTEHGVAH